MLNVTYTFKMQWFFPRKCRFWLTAHRRVGHKHNTFREVRHKRCAHMDAPSHTGTLALSALLHRTILIRYLSGTADVYDLFIWNILIWNVIGMSALFVHSAMNMFTTCMLNIEQCVFNKLASWIWTNEFISHYIYMNIHIFIYMYVYFF